MNLSIEVVRALLKFLERVPELGGIKSAQEAFEFCETFGTFQQVLQFQEQNLAHAKAARERAATAPAAPGVPFTGLPGVKNDDPVEALRAAFPNATIIPDEIPKQSP